MKQTLNQDSTVARRMKIATVRRFFRYSPMDAWLVALGIFQTTLLIAATLSVRAVPWWASASLGAVLAVLHLTNVNVVTHNAVHNPYFRSRRLNQAFSLYNSLGIVFPMEAYKVVHWMHHVYNNDGRDKLSIYRFGKDGRPESLLFFITSSHFRLDTSEVSDRLRRHRRQRAAMVELAFIAAAITVMTIINPAGVLFLFLPVTLVGWTLVHAESYLEHYGSVRGNRHANAVSSYGRIYNKLWFNNGYHMEHHYSPKTHWRKLPLVRRSHESTFQSNGYRVIGLPHLLSFWQRLSEKPEPSNVLYSTRGDSEIERPFEGRSRSERREKSIAAGRRDF